MRIAVVVFDGFDELDAIGPLEVLRNTASLGGDGLRVDLVALDGATEAGGDRRRPRGRAVVATVCTGAMLATAAGLTRGRPAVTHHDAIEDLRAAGAEVVEARVVDDGDLVTAGGVTSGIDMALWLVERHFGAELAAAVAAEIEHPRHGEVWRATPGQPSGR
jgi:putative intracellular protease/amidase